MSAVAPARWNSPSGVQLSVRIPRPYRLDDETIARAFLSRLPARVADLLDIAMEVHATDRLRTRSLSDPIGRGWCRDLPVAIRVRDLDFWSSHEVAATLTGLLDWLTDDHWEICFAPYRDQRSPAEAQGFLFSLRPGASAAVACFSGGLDSFGGAAIDLDEAADLELALVGASGTSRARSLQRELAGILRERTHRVQPVLVKANLVQAKRRKQDRHQRTRGFLFLSVAAAAAMVARVREVRVYENGVGAINLPYTDGQVGAHMSRSAHPKTLAGMQRLVALMGTGELRFRLPRVFDTKAMLVARISERFADVVPSTVSCDTWSSNRQPSPPGRERAHRCGTCSSCILRRQSLIAAGLRSVDAREVYRSDVLWGNQTEDNTFALRLMLEQVGELEAAINSDLPWHKLVQAFPQLVEARDALTELDAGPDIEGRLVAMYRTYVDEWKAVPAPLVHRYIGDAVAA